MKRKLSSIINSNEAGIRLDTWLSKTFPYFSRNIWQAEVRLENVLVNGEPAKPSKVLCLGYIVSLTTDEESEPDVDKNYSIIERNNDFVVVDKPPNISMHPTGAYYHNTLLSVVQKELSRKLYVVHRLDRETSGVTVFAANVESAKNLSKQFINKIVKKEYIVAVHGKILCNMNCKGYINLDNNSILKKKMKFIIDNNADENSPYYSYTEFELIKSNNGFSILKAKPQTGRLHQIRATMLGMGYPVIGDKLYGLDENIFERKMRDSMTDSDIESLIIPRQALHAYSISFLHPVNNDKVTFFSKIPKEITALCN